jgi:hypothetical protein
MAMELHMQKGILQMLQVKAQRRLLPLTQRRTHLWGAMGWFRRPSQDLGYSVELRPFVTFIAHS